MMAPVEGLTYTMPLEVYLQSAVIRGILSTNQDRLSNYLILREGQEVFSLREARLEDLHGKPIEVPSDEYLIYMQEVFLIADLSTNPRPEPSTYAHLHVKKEQSSALFNVGPYWVRGRVYLAGGAPLHDLLLAKSRFIPVTDATLLDRPSGGLRTYLVNRTKIGCLTALSYARAEF
jgi:hypothetical protein